MGFIIILILLAVDIITKQWALNVLAKSQDITVIKGFFDLAYLENRGAAFGILQNKVIFLALVTSVVILIMVFYMIKYKPQSKLLRYSFYLIMAGAVGNLIDRVRLGFVVDFLQFHYKEVYYFPTFNMADTFVVIGTALMILYVAKGVE